MVRAAGLSPSYTAELHLHTCYSFLEGASQPEELVERAAELGYRALAITDHDGLHGAMAFAQACAAANLRPITGVELTLSQGLLGLPDAFFFPLAASYPPPCPPPACGRGRKTRLLLRRSKGVALTSRQSKRDGAGSSPWERCHPAGSPLGNLPSILPPPAGGRGAGGGLPNLPFT